MTLLEITLVLGLGISIIVGMSVQSDNQLQILKSYKKVEYYSRDVPRMFTAVQNLTRGAKQLVVHQTTPPLMGAGPTMPIWVKSVSTRESGNALTILGSERREGAVGGPGAVNDEHVTCLWLVKRDDITPAGDRYVDKTGAFDLPKNEYHLAVASVENISGAGGGFGQDGWLLCKNIAGATFDFIPGTDGAVLMRIYRQEKDGDPAKLAFEMVLERR